MDRCHAREHEYWIQLETALKQQELGLFLVRIIIIIRTTARNGIGQENLRIGIPGLASRRFPTILQHTTKQLRLFALHPLPIVIRGLALPTGRLGLAPFLGRGQVG
jgi:hypothetical protein